ncbi:MAG: tyrosine-type recombinase/integrase [Candidatus Sulfotelmatobacter sp.]
MTNRVLEGARLQPRRFEPFKPHVDKTAELFVAAGAEFLPIYELDSPTDPMFVFLRFYIFLTIIIDRLPPHLRLFDAEKEFQKLFPSPLMTYAEFIAAFALHATQERNNSKNYDAPIDATLRKSWFKNTNISQDLIDKMFDSVSFSLDKLPEPKDTLGYGDFEFLRDRPTKTPVLLEFSRHFLEWLDKVRLEDKTETYYRDGWRLLKTTTIVGMRLDQITRDVSETLRFSGASSNANCALRTLRRMLHKAEKWTLIRHAPKLKLMKEYGRSLRLDDEAEKKLLAGAAACNWRKRSLQLFRDIIVLMRDTGMRNEWVFPSKRAESAHLTTMAKRCREARVKAGLPEDLVLYCGRHDYGTRILKRTGNLAAVMRTMGHRDVKTAMQYQHPELEIVRAPNTYFTITMPASLRSDRCSPSLRNAVRLPSGHDVHLHRNPHLTDSPDSRLILFRNQLRNRDTDPQQTLGSSEPNCWTIT